MNTVVLMVIAALFVPRTSDETIATSPLLPGEIAHEVGSDSATLFVGADDGYRVVADPAALRGYFLMPLTKDQMQTVADPNLNYDAVTDTWSLDEIGVARLVISCAKMTEIYDVSYDKEIEHTGIQSPESVGEIKKEIDKANNRVTITFTRSKTGWIDDHASRLWLQNLKIRYVGFGSTVQTVDLRTHIFSLRDDLGKFELGKLRHWTAHLYDGNRGQHWANYNATNTVRMAGHKLSFVSTDRISIRSEGQSNVVFYAAHHPALEIRATGTGEGYDRAFRFVNWKWFGTNDVAAVEFEHDIDEFDISQVALQYNNNSLDPNSWNDMPYTVAGPNRLEFSKTQYSGSCFRLIYRGAIVDQYSVRILAPLIIKGDDDKLYRIHINGGTISATEYTE